MEPCQQVVRSFLRGIEQSVHVEPEDDGACSVTLPLESVDGEPIRFYVEQVADRLVVSDEGETLGALFAYNVRRESPVADHLAATIRRFGLQEEDGALIKVSSPERLQQDLLVFTCAVQRIAALQMRRRRERSQHFDVKVRQVLADRSVPYDRQWTPQVEGIPMPIDFASLNHRALFLAAGSVTTAQGSLMQMLRAKVFTFQSIELAAVKTSRPPEYDRVVLMDEATQWPEDAWILARNVSEHVLPWPDEADEAEAILLTNAAPAPEG